MRYIQHTINRLTRPMAMVAIAAALSAALLAGLTAAPAAARSGNVFEIGDRVEVIADGLNVRAEPSLDAEVLFVAAEGTLGAVTADPVEVDGHGWVKVAFDAGGEGWVSGGYLTPAGDGGVEPPPPAQDGALIIGVATCPEGYAGENYAADCTTPAAGIDFAIGTPNTDNTAITTSRGDGLATFSLAQFAPGPLTVGEPIAQGLTYAVFCAKNEGEPLNFSYETIDYEPGGPLLGIRFEFNAGDQIACEWYNIPPQDGTTPPPLPTPRPMPPGDGDEVGGISQLPNTGTGAAAQADASRLGFLAPLALLAALTGAAVVGLRRRVRA